MFVLTSSRKSRTAHCEEGFNGEPPEVGEASSVNEGGSNWHEAPLIEGLFTNGPFAMNGSYNSDSFAHPIFWCSWMLMSSLPDATTLKDWMSNPTLVQVGSKIQPN